MRADLALEFSHQGLHFEEADLGYEVATLNCMMFQYSECQEVVKDQHSKCQEVMEEGKAEAGEDCEIEEKDGEYMG